MVRCLPHTRYLHSQNWRVWSCLRSSSCSLPTCYSPSRQAFCCVTGPLDFMYSFHPRCPGRSISFMMLGMQDTAGNVAWANDNKTLFYVTKDKLDRPFKVAPLFHLVLTESAKVVFALEGLAEILCLDSKQQDSQMCYCARSHAGSCQSKHAICTGHQRRKQPHIYQHAGGCSYDCIVASHTCCCSWYCFGTVEEVHHACMHTCLPSMAPPIT